MNSERVLSEKVWFMVVVLFVKTIVFGKKDEKIFITYERFRLL